MFKHILVPTDGSKLSGKAITQAIGIAKLSGAAITGLYVLAPYSMAMYGEAALYVPEASRKRYEELAQREADKALAVLVKQAAAAGINARQAVVTQYGPWEGIIRTAKAKKCDLIVMASHGRKGLAGLVLGSETTKVLTHSKVPVLVCR
ncbi:MAG: universal stress protein [Betaproteobacteria bacterium]